jgi:cyclic 2,3-diphosphoglycerate synthase
VSSLGQEADDVLADLAVVTLCDEVREAVPAESAIRDGHPRIEVVRTVFRPKPLGEVGGRRVFFCSTAPPRVGDTLSRHLEEVYGCEVVGMSHVLADRESLERQIRAAPPFDVLLTELKAGAVDVAVRVALAEEREVVSADNERLGDGIDEAFDRLLDRTRTDSEHRSV